MKWLGSRCSINMTDKEYLVEKLLSGTEIWNQWRIENPNQARLNLAKVNLSGANLCGVDLSEVNLSETNLSGANLSEANLKKANLFFANLEGADVRGADLRRAQLYYSNLRNTTFSRKTKINERWRRISFWLSNKVAKPYYWFGAELSYADLEGIDLSEAIIPYADLRGANLRNANLIGTNLEQARIWDTDLKGAKYSQDTILPWMSPIQRRSLIFVNIPQQPDNREVLVDLKSFEDERNRTNIEHVKRKDQQRFRDLLLDAFQGKCAISACDVERALDAAHIFPYRGPKTDCLWNGILLRLDLHRLFDSYLFTIDHQSGQVYWSPSLRSSYGLFANTQVCFPEKPVSENRKQVLRWHNAKCNWYQTK